jgi:hypothetical protein
VQRPASRASVWVYNGTKTPPELKQINVSLGVTDGTFSELLSGDIQVDQQVVTGVILPIARQNQPGQSIFGGPQRGMGGMTPGDRNNPPGGMPQNNNRGGGGGGGGGRGGGGRGGGN